MIIVNLIMRRHVVINVSQVTHEPSALYLGCHLDVYGHQLRALSSQLLLDESFESEQAGSSSSSALLAPWRKLGDPSHFRLDSENVFHGLQSMRITVKPDGGITSLANRGQFGAGFALAANRSYEGAFFALSHSTPPAVVRISLVNWRSGATLASADIQLTSASSLQRQSFDLPPLAAETTCDGGGGGGGGGGNEGDEGDSSGVSNGVSNGETSEISAASVCAGEFRLSVIGAADVSFDYVELHPGAWGRYKGLPVLASGVATLRDMGVRAVRFGGSFLSGANNSIEEWRRWRGAPYSRPSAVDPCWPAWERGHWHPSWCATLTSFGPFEFLALADAADLEPVLTLTAATSPSSLADLVEYCWGDAHNSRMGRQRASDGHPTPYRLRYIELGNEEYDASYLSQVVAMEERARALGIGGKLRYLFAAPGPDHDTFLNTADLAAAKRLSPRIDAQLIDSIHVGHSPAWQAAGAVGLARSLFESPALVGFRLGAACTETNARRQDMSRCAPLSLSVATHVFPSPHPRLASLASSPPTFASPHPTSALLLLLLPTPPDPASSPQSSHGGWRPQRMAQ